MKGITKSLVVIFVLMGFSVNAADNDYINGQTKIEPIISSDFHSEKVKCFYEKYLVSEGVDALLKKYISKDLLRSINYSSSCNYDSDDVSPLNNKEKMCSEKRECKTKGDNVSCNWNGIWIETDVDYFTKSQDFYPSWSKHVSVSLVAKYEDSESYKVSLGMKPDPIMQLRVIVSLVDGNWKIRKVTEY
ncbi:DUF3828 domain-containing protein [Pantoea leporis]|jgi:hypothetical protein|uniref:DUF3828 domain-containing protein n=1 Tax=Pantoea leporis TaxID=2933780 RepID=UPI00230356F4|nr:DUF3828 domain-containing protein [Pantoea leporis]